jgi:polar amino acid transport system substrate-binding protein
MKRMKRLTAFKTLALTILFAVTTLANATPPAMASSHEAGESHSVTPAMDRILKSGKLRVGLTAQQPPFNMKTKTGQIIGLEADLAQSLASSMGVTVEYVVKDFAELLPAVTSGEIDMALSGLTMTPERNTRVAFAGPYFISGKGLITTSAALAKTDEPADLDGSGVKLVALKDSTSYLFIQNAAPNATALSAKNYDEGIQMVIDGKADAMVADYPICLVALFQHPDAGLESAISPFTFEPLGAALPSNDALFLNLVQNFMGMLEDSGLMTGLRAKWFDSGDWLAELP